MKFALPLRRSHVDAVRKQSLHLAAEESLRACLAPPAVGFGRYPRILYLNLRMRIVNVTYHERGFVYVRGGQLSIGSDE